MPFLIELTSPKRTNTLWKAFILLSVLLLGWILAALCISCLKITIAAILLYALAHPLALSATGKRITIFILMISAIIIWLSFSLHDLSGIERDLYGYFLNGDPAGDPDNFLQQKLSRFRHSFLLFALKIISFFRLDISQMIITICATVLLLAIERPARRIMILAMHNRYFEFSLMFIDETHKRLLRYLRNETIHSAFVFIIFGTAYHFLGISYPWAIALITSIGAWTPCWGPWTGLLLPIIYMNHPPFQSLGLLITFAVVWLLKITLFNDALKSSRPYIHTGLLWTITAFSFILWSYQGLFFSIPLLNLSSCLSVPFIENLTLIRRNRSIGNPSTGNS